jgi:D-beta-D-heptose 7-phosphate kinase / D-beta-D-heptose 1-phosphate adenosyltransferase
MTPIDMLIEANERTPKKICVIGDSMEDVWLHGTLSAGQEGCPLFREESSVTTPGGAANAARQLHRWNSHTSLIAPLRACSMSEPWKQIDGELAFSCSSMPVKVRMLVDGKVVFRSDRDSAYFTNDYNRDECRRLALSAVRSMGFDAVLISDYEKGFLDEDLIGAVIRACEDQKIPCVADAKRDAAFYQGAVIKGNDAWLGKNLGHKIHPSVITKGAGGAFVLYPDHTHWVKAGPPVTCVNHVGSGDCFAAHLTLALAHGLTLKEAALVAHAAGRVYVTHEHCRPPWPHEIRKDIDPSGGKIIGSSRLAALRQSIPGRVVFANGCFDLLHAGHVHLLHQAWQAGDVLVIGVNDDESVRRLKGPSRPVVPLTQRMETLAALEWVDWIVPFSGDTPVEVMRELKPDVLAKGKTGERNTAGDELAGEVKLFEPLAGWSTTATVERIRAQ